MAVVVVALRWHGADKEESTSERLSSTAILLWIPQSNKTKAKGLVWARDWVELPAREVYSLESNESNGSSKLGWLRGGHKAAAAAPPPPPTTTTSVTGSE